MAAILTRFVMIVDIVTMLVIKPFKRVLPPGNSTLAYVYNWVLHIQAHVKYSKYSLFMLQLVM